ncbi:hypothetical protein BDN72DRAFT_753619 [Pluteus cervinus]|uniref:Uncharacterized protein n=1 Tax=Pluteus cervinus TaxID=181527 RepID=A0ACD3BGL2_9AGAR|nr:hypothetical protein BDN72DRAFT_753619 [Pluteus cervinus]
MPKSAKKRKVADFSKAKLKLGKGKKTPSNVIDTSFKARSIALPTQSITTSKDTREPTTKRNLSFDDLLAHLKHYNANTRKEAFIGLRELFEEHWDTLSLKLPPLVNACARIIGDEDAGVRRALADFFKWLFPRIPQEDLVPHSPTLLLFTTSAQTHIFPEIRIDAIRFLDILLEAIPQPVAEGWTNGSTHGGRVLLGYLGILNAGVVFDQGAAGPLKMTSTTSLVLSPKSKLVVIKSLATFLRCCLQSDMDRSEASPCTASSIRQSSTYLLSFFTNRTAYTTFSSLILPNEEHQNQLSWDIAKDPVIRPYFSYASWALDQSPPWSLSDLSNIPTSLTEIASDETRTNHSFIAHLAGTLQPILVSVILDCTPVICSPGSNAPGNEVEIFLATVQIIRAIYRPLLQESDALFNHLETLLGYLIPYFPFHLRSDHDNKLSAVSQELNIYFCELSSLMMLAQVQTPQNTVPKSTRPRKFLADATLTDRLVKYISQLLRGEGLTDSEVGRPLSATFYRALLPTIWALLSISEMRIQSGANDQALEALLEHGTKISATSAVKPLSIHFIGQLLLLGTEPHYRGHFKLLTGDIRVREWLDHLPRCLWEAGERHPVTTEVVLRLLLRLHQRNSKRLTPPVVASIRSKLVPYFTINHPTRGQLDGPFHKISGSLRRLALDVVCTICREGSSLPESKSLRVAVSQAVAKTGERGYWEHLDSS